MRVHLGLFSHFTATNTKHTSGLGTSRPSLPGLCLPPQPTMRETPSGSVTLRHPPPGMTTAGASLAGLALKRPFVVRICPWLAAVDTASILTPGMNCRWRWTRRGPVHGPGVPSRLSSPLPSSWFSSDHQPTSSLSPISLVFVSILSLCLSLCLSVSLHSCGHLYV